MMYNGASLEYPLGSGSEPLAHHGSHFRRANFQLASTCLMPIAYFRLPMFQIGSIPLILVRFGRSRLSLFFVSGWVQIY